MSIEQERLAAIDVAADDILEAARRHEFGNSLYGMLMCVDALFNHIEEQDPPPNVKRAYRGLHSAIKDFLHTGLPPLVRVAVFKEDIQ